MNKKIVNRYIEVARALKPKSQSGKSFHITCIFDKSKILSLGINDYKKEHRRHLFGSYKPTKGSGSYIPGIHSEMSALLKLGEEDCSKFTFLNIRIDNNFRPAMSKPCLNCQKILNQIGYKKIFYTTGDERLIMEN